MNMMGIDKIISGGQTGVDRGALEFALSQGVLCEGYCPRGRRCEEGRIPDRYPLTEIDSQEYMTRTRKNVSISDGTLILVWDGRMDEGTHNTIECCKELGRPYIILDLSFDIKQSQMLFLDWLELNQITALNVAGDRESDEEGLRDRTIDFLERLFDVKKVA